MKKFYFAALFCLAHFFISAQTEFITTWKTDNPGTSNDNQITIPTFAGETYNYTVDWGDGTSDTNVTGDITHTYAVVGTYTVTITGLYPRSYFAPLETIEDDAEKILTIEQWGTQQWTSMWSAFASCKNLDVVATDAPDLSLVENAGEMFRFCSSLQGNSSFDNWDLSNVLATFNMFDGATLFNQDISGWVTGNVVNMQAMFMNAQNFNQDISGWDVGKVTSTILMFSGATNFNQNIGNWDVSGVTNMIDMFQNAGLSQANYDSTLLGWSGLPSLQSGVQFNAGNSTYCNGEIPRNILVNDYGWIVTDAGKDCPFITTWKTDNPGTSGSNQITIPTFFGEVYDYTVDWGDGTSDTGVTGDITHTYATSGTYEVAISGTFPRIYFNENGDADKLMILKQWGSIAWTSMESAFAGCPNLSVAANDIPDLSGVTNLRRMFFYCNYSFDFTGTREYANFNGVENFNHWDVGTITNMSNMFDKSSFNQDILSWDVSQVQDMSNMFYSSSFNNPIGNWDVGNVENMEGLFGSSMFNQDISNWDVGSVVNLNLIFNSTYFNHDISGWNVANVTSMQHAFSQGHFDQDLSAWDVSNVTDMSNAFDDSDLSRENYDAILSAWAQLPGLQSGVVLGANDAVYCLSEVDRNSLVSDHGWTINDDGKNCDPEVPFVTTWKTDNPGPSNDNQITIPTSPREIYDYRVDWGDGTSDDGVTGDITHTYAQPGVYQVSITGKFPRIYFNGSLNSYEFSQKNSDDLKLVSVDQWGSNRWKSMSYAFAGCENMDVKATDIPDFSRGIAMNGMFLECSSFIGNASISNWNVQGVSSMFLMFKDASNFNIPIGTWDMSGMQYMDWAFENASSFDQDLSGWNVANVNGMLDLFKGSGLSNANYNSILIGWSQLPSLKNGVQLGAPDNYYCSAAEARQFLIDTYNWVINDAGANGECNFVTTWKTNNPGASADNQVTIPTFVGETYNYTVDWGDGTSDAVVTGDITHTYATAGTYSVSISGEFPRIFFVDGAKDFEKLIAVNNWGEINWSSMAGAFAGCSNLDVVATDVPDLSNVQSMQSMFLDCFNLVGNNSFSSWDVSNVTDMFGVFTNATMFNQHIGGWNVSNVIDMGAMFLGATTFDQDISSWNVSNVTRMVNMFSGASSFNQNIEEWDVAKVDDMAYMFRAANSFDQNIGSWNVASVNRMEGMFMVNQAFNQDISGWDVSNVTGMGVMFLGAELFNQDISGWDVSNVTDMDSMFQYAFSFDQNLGAWDVSKVTSMAWMFLDVPLSTSNYDDILKGWSSLPSLQNGITLDVNLGKYCSAASERQSIIDNYGWIINDAGANTECYFSTTWKTDNPGTSTDNQITIPTVSGVTYDYFVDWGDGSSDINVTGDITHTYATPGTYEVLITGQFPQIYFNDQGDKDKILRINRWGGISWSSMLNAFHGCTNLDVVAEDAPDLSNVTTTQYMFRLCGELMGNATFNTWDMSSVLSMDFMFREATKFNQDISNWDVGSAITMMGMFLDAKAFNQNLNLWNVQNVTTMERMFRGAESFDQDLDTWDTSKVVNMYGMFFYASVFNGQIGSWNVANVTNMSNMFTEARAFNQDISNWDTSSATEMASMFGLATSFNQDLNAWNVSNVTNMAYMFENATSFNGNISSWNVSNVQLMGNMFNGASSFNQDISAWDVSSVTEMTGMLAGATPFDQDLGNWDISNVTDMSTMLYGVTLSTDNYDSLLAGWGALPSLQNNVVFDAGNSQYCSASEERQTIIDTYGWTINDAGANTACYFVTTWKTDNPGVSGDNQITVPTFLGETYDYTIDWGDGTSDTNVTGDITHTYAIAGTYQVSISGDFPRIYFNGNHDPDSNDVLKILSVKQWGSIVWSSFESAFEACSNLDVEAQDSPDLSMVSSLKYMFDSCASLIGNSSFNDWDVSNVSNMNGVFANTDNFDQYIGGWNMSNVTNTAGMFFKSRSFNQPIDSWEVHKVEDMSYMFGYADRFNQPLNSWNTGSVKIMGGAFSYALDFNQSLASWNLSNVENMQFMFLGAKSFNQSLNSWDVSAVTNMYGMFQAADGFNQPLNSWNVTNVINMSSMFWNASSFNQNIEDWDVSNVTTMNSMFKKALAFDQDLGSWDITNVTGMYEMFSEAGISTSNYDQTLVGWSNLSSLQSNVSFDAGNSQYCDGTEARQFIMDTYGWTITDGGEHPLCGQDNDVDGVPDYIDDCLDSQPGAVVNENGCDRIPFDAILVYVLTPSCVGSDDGAIVVSMNTSGYALDISIEGNGISNLYSDQLSGTDFEINDLPVGVYSVTISIPEILFEQAYGVAVNELSSVSGKRSSLDATLGQVQYKVQGSKHYEVVVNGRKQEFNFENNDEQTILLQNLSGQTEISIMGENVCQGLITDSFFIGDIIQVYPTITSASVNFLTKSNALKVRVFSLDGRLVKELEYDQQNKKMDVSSLKSGIYVLQLEMNGRNETVKIVKR